MFLTIIIRLGSPPGHQSLQCTFSLREWFLQLPASFVSVLLLPFVLFYYSMIVRHSSSVNSFPFSAAAGRDVDVKTLAVFLMCPSLCILMVYRHFFLLRLSVLSVPLNFSYFHV